MPDLQVDNEEGWCMGMWAVVRERERESRKVSSDIKCPAIPMCGAVNTGF